MMLQHNGEITGGSSLGFHLVPNSGEVTPSATVVVAFNQNVGLGDKEFGQLFSIVQACELQVSWPDQDLFPPLT